MKKSILVAAAIAALSSSSVFAGGSVFGGSSSEDSTGAIYGGASIGQSSDGSCEAANSMLDELNDLAGSELLATSDCANASAWKVFGGYKVTPNLAVEGSYNNLGKYTDSAEIQAIPGVNVDPNLVSTVSEMTAIGVSGVASTPITNEFNVFGKMGVASWSKETELSNTNTRTGVQDPPLSAKTDGVDLTLGAGAEYKINDNWGVRGEVERFDGLNANLYSVGASFSTF
ncbi:outer membrane beta-barrel protein [Thiothrix winogradskyi]|uniref:Outer membrane beta-barrel protein n=1 Tax=Thiothrix winogradskyi TaxID=96472 RepID=A0ABY3STR2_9GAMM|nr:outer membrane beta-barrel protein [Thiothrix winogradskyi]UJS22912.1 outer membrane beta-barrel protein [Thiothrix winogradskyi]